MSKARASVGNFRVDWIDGDKCTCFGFFDTVRAWDKYVEGVAKAFDEVLIFDFAGGRRSAVLLASHTFRKRKFYGYKEKGNEGSHSSAAAEVRQGA